jgi:hypothetical protein
MGDNGLLEGEHGMVDGICRTEATRVPAGDQTPVFVSTWPCGAAVT